MYSHFTVSDINVLKQKVLNWLKQFNTFCFLDSNQYPGNYEWLIGAGTIDYFQSSSENALVGLQDFISRHPTWMFGHIGYELVTSEKTKHTDKEDHIQFPDVFFFEPEIVLLLKGNILNIQAPNPIAIFTAIEQTEISTITTSEITPEIKSRINKDEYIHIITQLQNHIQRGDCYEINFCQEFYIENTRIDPFSLFNQLNSVSPNPFSGFYRTGNTWLLCASPERFIQKIDNRIISQPIKGTLQRKTGSDTEQNQLLQSEKDKAENVMIVDLVRNDLSRICKEGSVDVDELFGIYSFPQVHQMISTISGVLQKNTSFANIIDAVFPMGSMTGAPKIKVMELINTYEKSKRGIFSGALGYITPAGDFDLNVVIRSIMYNQINGYLSFQAGSGITAYSNAEKEWEECMLKAKAIKAILNR